MTCQIKRLTSISNQLYTDTPISPSFSVLNVLSIVFHNFCYASSRYTNFPYANSQSADSRFTDSHNTSFPISIPIMLILFLSIPIMPILIMLIPIMEILMMLIRFMPIHYFNHLELILALVYINRTKQTKRFSTYTFRCWKREQM